MKTPAHRDKYIMKPLEREDKGRMTIQSVVILFEKQISFSLWFEALKFYTD